jgi:hypothetical protein
MNYDDWKLMTPYDDDDDKEKKTIYCEDCNQEICFDNESKINDLCIECYKLLY